MVKYIIDNNLPFRFSHWNKPEYIFVRNLNPNYKDREIWEIAKKQNLIIVTKDTDFYNRIIISKPPPKVIHFKIGNFSIGKFHDFISTHWVDICELSEKNKLVVVYEDRTEIIE